MGDQRPVSIIVSDLHMGAADAYDDFVYQKNEFSSFVDELTASDDGRRGRIELLINGDFLELAQVNPDAYKLGSSEFWCSEAESLLKLEPILKGHTDIFAAIKRFLGAGNRCTLFAGNHDVELYWEKVQARIREAAGSVDFELGKTWFQRYDGRLRLSHGHMFDPANCFANWANPVKASPDGPRLEMCAGTLFMVQFVNWMEHEYPFADNIHPNWRLATILWKEARDGFALAAWLMAKFASRHPQFTLGKERKDGDLLQNVSEMGDWVVAALRSNPAFQRDVTALWNEIYKTSNAVDEVTRMLDTPEEVEKFTTELVVRVSPERWLPVFNGVRPRTLQIAKSGRWKSNEALRAEAGRQWEDGAEIVTIGHTHELDQVIDGSKRYYNTGSWTRSLPWSKDAELTLDKLKDERWFPYELTYLRVEQRSGGTLHSEIGSRGRS
jgi:UDP-2,3-diacylglucosamine pyrophosphatase LpxH